jgi:hypothetical protein
MFPDFGRCGAIDDVGFGLRWETGTIALEVARRAATLAQRRIGPGSVVAISHSGSAHFFCRFVCRLDRWRDSGLPRVARRNINPGAT